MKVLYSILIASGVLLSSVTAGAQTLRETVGRQCLIGSSINTVQARGGDAAINDIVDKHFNCLVAENCMKSEVLQPNEGLFDFRQADQLVKYAEEHNATLMGHCLIWHSQTPRWFFQDELGNKATRELMIQRIKDHVKNVVTHFRGKVKGWDVVNEAIEDDGSYRNSEMYQIVGPEFIEIAFRAAMEADPDCELYLNDYSMAKPGKRQKYVEILRDFKAKGIRVDAIGMQSHNGMDYPDLAEYEKSIEAFAAEGVKVMMTELDINVLPNPENFGGAEISQNFEYQEKMNPYRNGLPEEAAQKIEQRWMEFWQIYHRHRDVISRINIWGIEDGCSWLNGWPVAGRTNYPLLFDRNKQAKPVVEKIAKLYMPQETVVNKKDKKNKKKLK